MDTAELKSRAKEQLRGKWAIAVGTVLVANIILEVDVGYKVASKLGIEGLSYSLDLIALLLDCADFYWIWQLRGENLDLIHYFQALIFI